MARLKFDEDCWMKSFEQLRRTLQNRQFMPFNVNLDQRDTGVCRKTTNNFVQRHRCYINLTKPR